MEITKKRQTPHKRLHKDKSGMIIGSGRHSNKLIQDITSLTPLREKGVKVSGVSKAFIGESLTVPVSENIYTRYQVFHDDPIFESQVYIGLIYEAMTWNKNLYDMVIGVDWDDVVITNTKRDVLTELGSYIQDAIGFNLDFVDFYSESTKDFISVKEDLKNPEVCNNGFNVNVTMFFRLLKSWTIVVKETEAEYMNGSAILYSPFSSEAESPSYICQNSKEKPFCVTQYFMDKSNPPSTYTRKLAMLTKEHLDMVTPDIYQNLGYSSIYEYLVKKGLNLQ